MLKDKEFPGLGKYKKKKMLLPEWSWPVGKKHSSLLLRTGKEKLG